MLTEIRAYPSDRHTLFQTWIIHMWLLFFQAGSGRLGILREGNRHEVSDPHIHNCFAILYSEHSACYNSVVESRSN